MSVTARFQMEKPEEMNATMQITMSLADWKAIRGGLSSGTGAYSSTMLIRAIDDLIAQAGKVFYSRMSDDEAGK